jgi:hypothetical protein
MRFPKSWRLFCFLVLGFALLLIGAWIAGWIPSAAQYCEYNPYTEHEKCAVYQIPVVVVRYIGWFLDAVSSALTAIATVAIGAFTYTLYKATTGLKDSTDKLWDAGERQIKVAGDAAVAAEKAAGAAQRSAEIANNSLITTERAFVFLDDIDPAPVFGLRGSGNNNTEIQQFPIRPRWRNSGNTPTRNMAVIVNWTYSEGDLPGGFTYAYGENDEPSPMFLGPQATEWSEAVHIPGNVATDALKGKGHIFIWGRVEYHDIFDDTPLHFTEWCYRVLFVRTQPHPLPQFVAFGPYNGSDEDSRQHA